MRALGRPSATINEKHGTDQLTPTVHRTCRMSTIPRSHQSIMLLLKSRVFGFAQLLSVAGYFMCIFSPVFGFQRKEKFEMLEKILAPYSTQDFFHTYFEQRVLHIDNSKDTPSNGQLFRQDLLTLEILEEIVLAKKLNRNTDVQFIANNEYINDDIDIEFDFDDSYDSHLNVQTLKDHYEAGHMLQVTAMERFDERLKDLKCTLEGEIFASVGVNVYFSPPNMTGFSWHKDGHDIIVIQTVGKKCWEICEHLPAKLDVSSYVFSNKEEVLKSDVRCRNITLHKGEAFYMPRGVIHAPHTRNCEGQYNNSEQSMHLSIGIDFFSNRWGSVINTQIFEGYETSPINEEALAPPGHHESWTWRDLLSSVILHALHDDTLLGSKLQAAFPLFAISSLLIGRANCRHSYLLDVRKLSNKSVWSEIHKSFISIIDGLRDSCGSILEPLVIRSLENGGVSKSTVLPLASEVARKCSLIIESHFTFESFLYSVGKVAGYIVSQHNVRCTNKADRYAFNENIWLDANISSSNFGGTCNAEMASSIMPYQYDKLFTRTHGAIFLLMPVKIRKRQILLLGPNGAYYVPASLNQSLYKLMFQNQAFVPLSTVPPFAVEVALAMYEVGSVVPY
jgi:hypothetical protein